MPEPSRDTWIESRRFDLSLLALAPVFGLIVAGAALAVGEQTLLRYHFIELVFFFVGMPHYLSTYTFYMGDENAAHYRSRKLAFYAGPFIIGALLTASLALHLFAAVALVVNTWNVFHVCRQNAGILSIYRHKNGGNNLAEKLPANLAILFVSGGMYTMTLESEIGMDKLIPRLPFNFIPYISPALFAVGAVALIVLLRQIVARPGRPAASELIFLTSSVALFVPFFFITSRPLANTAMLIGHFVQYMGILWLLNHRKYAGASGSRMQRGLAFLSRGAGTVVAAMISIALSMFLVDRAVHAFGLIAFHTLWLNLVVLLHFYLDGLFWSFRDPYTRSALGPFLVRYTRPAPAGAPARSSLAGAVS